MASFLLVIFLALFACGAVAVRSTLSIRGGHLGGGSHGDVSDASSSGSMASQSGVRVLEVTNAPSILQGIFFQTEWGLNGRPHYEKNVRGDARGSKVHLYWSGSQWIFHFDLDPSRNFENLVAYSKVRVADARHTCNWHVRRSDGVSYEVSGLHVGLPGAAAAAAASAALSRAPSGSPGGELFGVPRVLLPLYFSFLMDAIAVGLATPLLPFYVMELGANALQLSMVISCNYVAMALGSLAVGRLSDLHGRRPVLLCCLVASSLSYFCVSRARTLVQVGLARVIVGAFGGLNPVMQSCVADVSSLSDRPKYLGRITATFGLGFVLGPALSAAAAGLTTREKIGLSSLLPLFGYFVSLLFFNETKAGLAGPKPGIAAAQSVVGSGGASRGGGVLRGPGGSQQSSRGIAVAAATSEQRRVVSSPVLILVLNGFLLMYACATETIYAMFMQDSFGYGERVLSALLAFCGLFIGLFQVFLIKPLVGSVGKHGMLAAGNAVLAIGLVGVALVRDESVHFALFVLHIVGYTVADTALVSLITRYSSPQSLGRDLSLNQAAQSVGRVLSPLVAGLLYEHSRARSRRVPSLLPAGALPFLVAAVLPAVGVLLPFVLLLQSRARKAKSQTKPPLAGGNPSNLM